MDEPRDQRGLPDLLRRNVPEQVKRMKFFVTGVCGRLGHDVMNELAKRGYEAVGTALKLSEQDKRWDNMNTNPAQNNELVRSMSTTEI